MIAQEYVELKLEELKTPSGRELIEEESKLATEIYSALTTKKFRKFSMSEELKTHVSESIELNIKNNEPINITFLHGAYKLWRLDESPEVDWAELFALMRYINWVKPVCEMYEPGVLIDFFIDDYIVPMLNNVEMDEVEKYIDSYQELLDFLANYKPKNLKMTINTVGSRFESQEAFKASVFKNLKEIESQQQKKLPELTQQIEAMIELNARPTEEQLADPNWKKKIWNLHNAYSITKAEPGYHKNRPEKILAFTSSLPMAIGVGTTNKAVMKFWVGSGVLRKDGDDFDQDILSPKQLETVKYEWEGIDLGIPGKNFSRIRIADS